MRQKAVVTGGAGFIGSHLVEALHEYDVTVWDDLSTGKLSNLARPDRDRIRIVRGDIRNPATVKVVLRNAAIVFHHAAIVSVPWSVKNPILTNAVNVGGTLNLLNAAVKNKVRRFIYASSAAVYGEQGKEPVKEDARPSPLSPYAASKVAGESYCQAFFHTYGLETVSLRYFNVYGPRQRTDDYSGVITRFMDRAKRGLALEIFGDGKQTRDFTYVSDAVRANLLAAESERAAGKVFNVGTGRPTTISDLAESIIKLYDPKRKVSVRKKPRRQGDVKYSCADISKAKHLLEYQPKVTLKDGLRNIA